MPAYAKEPPAARRPWEIASLVLCWLVLTLVLAVLIWVVAQSGEWRSALQVAGMLGIWAALTALLVRRLWPRSRLAAALADPKQERLEQPVRHGGLVLLGVLLGAVVLVLALLYLGWTV